MTLQISSLKEYQEVYKRSVEDPEGFWAEQADYFKWEKKWDQVLSWNFDEAQIEWFKGAKLNITVNCLDRHIEQRGDDVAILWEPNDPGQEAKSYTYKSNPPPWPR